MKIALIGSEYSIRRINSLVDLRKIFIDTDEYICKFDEVAPLLERIQDQYDGILFSGVLYFLRAERSVRAKVPWTYPRRSIASVLCALLKAQRAGYDISKVTYDLEDVPSERYLELLRDYVGLPAEDVRIFRYNDSEFYRRYLRGLINANNYSEDASAFHLDNLNSGRASLCLTGAISVTRALPSDRYPTVLVTLTEEDALAAVNELRTKIQARSDRAAADFLPTVIHLSIEMDRTDGGFEEYRYLRSTQQVALDVYSFARNIGAAVETHGSTEYLLYTTRDDLYAATAGLTDFELAFNIQFNPDILGVYVGIGFGSTYSIANQHAQSARKSAENQKMTCYYVVDEEDLPNGPFIMHRTNSRRAISEIQIERIAEETGVAVSVLNDLARAKAQFELRTVTSEQLAHICGLSVNNMNRVIAKLEKNGYVEIIGTRPGGGPGRPKRLIRLNLGTTL